jgi:hypothetical protein
MLDAIHNLVGGNGRRGRSVEAKAGRDAVDALKHPASVRAFLLVQFVGQAREVHSRSDWSGGELDPALVSVSKLDLGAVNDE